jgi:hypothetical protein
LDFSAANGGPGHRPVDETLPVSIRVWLAAAGADVGIAKADIAYATAVFGLERTGITFNATGFSLLPGTSVVLRDNSTAACNTMQTQLTAAGISPLGKQHFNVIYVDEVLDMLQGVDLVPVPSGFHGFACPLDTYGNIVLVSWAKRSATLVAHELGHAMGLRESGLANQLGGHTVGMPRFSYTNVMWDGDTDEHQAARAHLSLGQAFRINLDDHTWIFRRDPKLRSWPGRDCPDDGGGNAACPKLAWDVVPLPP